MRSTGEPAPPARVARADGRALYEVWAAVIVLAVIGSLGLAYLLIAKPDRNL